MKQIQDFVKQLNAQPEHYYKMLLSSGIEDFGYLQYGIRFVRESYTPAADELILIELKKIKRIKDSQQNYLYYAGIIFDNEELAILCAVISGLASYEYQSNV